MYRDLCFIFSHSDRVRFILLIILMLLGSFIEMATLGAVPLYVSALIGHAGAQGGSQLAFFLGKLGSSDRNALAAWGGLALASLFLFRTVYFMFNYMMQERVLRNRQIALGSRIFSAYMNAPYTSIRMMNSSTVINNVSSETERLINQMLDPALNLVRNTVVALTILGLLLWFDPIVSLVSFTVLGISGCAFMTFAHRRMKTLGEQGHLGRQAAIKAVSEGIGIFKEATILGCKNAFIARLHKTMERQAYPLRISNTMQKCLWPFMELLTVAVLLGSMAAMLLFGRDVESAAPTLALLTVCLARMKGCLTEIMFYFSTLRYNASVLASVAKELRTLENAARPQAQNKTAPAPALKTLLEVKDLAFTFPDAAQPLLHNVNMAIPQGASAAFVGPTGSGKTTMADIILGLLPPTSGSVLADGVDIAENPAAWQGQIGFVPQEIYLLDASIRENIALGIPQDEVDENALYAAINAASLQDFIASLPNGVGTVVGERGMRISGGQRQRIGIARALYRNPSILVFDEATSALDAETEAAVVSAMETLREKHTLIIVAHRLTTIERCKPIFFFDRQLVAKFDSFAELDAAMPDFTATHNKRKET